MKSYMNCARIKVLDRLTEFINKVWEEDRVPKKWMQSDCYIKEDTRVRVSTNAIVNTMGKVFSVGLTV